MSKLIMLMQALVLINFLLFVTGCVTHDADAQEVIATDIKEKTQVPETTDAQASIQEAKEDTDESDSLRGTCPRGGHCGSPGCGLWSDLNKDNLCDRAA